jgi:hypothetical protein
VFYLGKRDSARAVGVDEVDERAELGRVDHHIKVAREQLLQLGRVAVGPLGKRARATSAARNDAAAPSPPHTTDRTAADRRNRRGTHATNDSFERLPDRWKTQRKARSRAMRCVWVDRRASRRRPPIARRRRRRVVVRVGGSAQRNEYLTRATL